jgi:hypothetical protein
MAMTIAITCHDKHHSPRTREPRILIDFLFIYPITQLSLICLQLIIIHLQLLLGHSFSFMSIVLRNLTFFTCTSRRNPIA